MENTSLASAKNLYPFNVVLPLPIIMFFFLMQNTQFISKAL
jgi:hypothetical protein